MASAQEWEARVVGWRRSGLTSEEFCKGRDFTAGGLRHWSYRVRQKEKLAAAEQSAVAPKAQAKSRAPVRFARVSRDVATEPETTAGAVVIEVGGARVSVRRGFDAATLGAVLGVLGVRGGA